MLQAITLYICSIAQLSQCALAALAAAAAAPGIQTLSSNREMSQQRLVVLDIFSSNIAAAFSSSRGHSPLQVFYFLLLHYTRQPSLLG